MPTIINLSSESRLCLYFHYGGIDETLASGFEGYSAQLA